MLLSPHGRAVGQQSPDPELTVGGPETSLVDAWTGFGLRGFDPVSFFLQPAPEPGREGLELIWRGIAWRFASEANRAAFDRDPEVFAPRIGGYDASAAAEGQLFRGEPTIFAISAERLYLFRTEGAKARFLRDPSLAGGGAALAYAAARARRKLTQAVATGRFRRGASASSPSAAKGPFT
jgi:hypothetical protein